VERQAQRGASADVVLNGGRLNAGRSTLCRETQAHTLPSGPIETIKPSRSSKLEPFQEHLVVLSFRESRLFITNPFCVPSAREFHCDL